MATALLVMDLQKGIVSRIDTLGDDFLPKTASTIASARKAGIKIIYVIARFRAGYPEINQVNATFGRIKSMGANVFTEGDESSEIHPAVAPLEGDVTVAKHRVSAFPGTDLEMILRSQGVQHLVLTGLATSGVVLSTVRAAADMDYQFTVLKDLCADRDAQVHEVLTEKIFPHQGKVMTSEEWVAQL